MCLTIQTHKERVDVERVSLYKSKNMSKYTEDDLKVELENKEYEYGFYTELDSETFPIGLNEDIVRAISKKKEEPECKRKHLSEQVLEYLREANSNNSLKRFREDFTPSNDPFYEQMQENRMSIQEFFCFDKNNAVFTIGESYCLC